MGCGGSSQVNDFNELVKWTFLMEGLHLNIEELKKFFSIFSKIDNDKSGSIKLAELLLFLKLENNEFMRRAFSIFDEDKSGQVDFGEFVVSVWNYCTLNNSSLILFAFDLYDEDVSGYISKSEVKKLLRDIFGGSLKRNQFAMSTIAKVDMAIDNFISDDVENQGSCDGFSIRDFTVLTKNNPTLLFGAFEIQATMQKAILGVYFWTRLSKQMLQLSDGSVLSVAEFKEKVRLLTCISKLIGFLARFTFLFVALLLLCFHLALCNFFFFLLFPVEFAQVSLEEQSRCHDE